ALTSTQTLPESCESRFLNPPSAAAVALTGSQTLPECESCFLVCLLFADCQGNPQSTMTSTVVSILKHHLIFERFHSIQVGAAICMCAQQIFFDGSAKKRTFTSAFERAVAVFSEKASASGFLDEIEPWVDQRTEDMTNLDSYTQSVNMVQEVADMMKKYRPLIFGEVKG
ncbi:hypothetical protein B0H13DRAFT_2066903, partial [Mycena leptocephala]